MHRIGVSVRACISNLQLQAKQHGTTEIGNRQPSRNLTAKIISAPEKNNIVIFMSSVRPNRMGDRVAKFAETVLKSNDTEYSFFDPLKMPFDILRIPLHFYQKQEDAPGWLIDANNVLVDADGFLLLTTEYNSLPPPALINMLNHFPADSYRHRPCGIISYSMGQLGGYRAATLIRPIISELCMLPMGISVPIPTVHTLIDPEGKCSSDLVETSTQKLIKELNWYADALKIHRKLTPPPFG